MTALSLCLLGTAAPAQDLFYSAAPTANTWSGFYLGAQFGLIGAKTHEKGSAFPSGEALLGDIPVQGGLFAGAHYQMNDWWVWGLDAEANYEPGEFFYNGSKFGTIEWDGALRLHGGYLIAPNVLAFGSVGYSIAHFDHTTYYSVGHPALTGAAYTGGGIQLGFGVDAKLSDHLMARLLATWSHYGVHTIYDGGTAIATSEPSMVNARLGLAWSF